MSQLPKVTMSETLEALKATSARKKPGDNDSLAQNVSVLVSSLAGLGEGMGVAKSDNHLVRQLRQAFRDVGHIGG